LWAFSTPLVSAALVHLTEIRGPDLHVALAGKDRTKVALIVLGGGVRQGLPMVAPRERLSGAATQRAVTAARLWTEQRFGTVIVTSMPDEAAALADLLSALGVPADLIVREERSTNTRTNALYSAEILRERSVSDAVVVSSASHLRRALKDFAAVGVTAIPAAADILGESELGIDAFLPSSWGLGQTHTALHEILGYVRG
jgi:uncharacterized SAM-binding protein YcdF (DUF218 family)